MARHENVLGLRDTSADTKTARRTTITSRGNVRKRPTEELTEEEKAELIGQAVVKASRARELADRRKKLIIGIDLGTTNSGVSYVQSTGEPGDVSTIKNWTGRYSDLCSKVPSVMAYACENDHLDKDQWEYGVKAGDICCQWWKLLLDGSTRRSDFDDPLLDQSVGEGLMHLPEGKTAQDIASDFLGNLYRHTIQTLKSNIGSEALAETPILFQCTVPAKWSHAAREATRQAAQRAGIASRYRDELVMTDEPEAGAIAAISLTVAGFGSNPFKKNTSHVVVDAGGGTVDLTSFKIQKDDPLKLEEACVADGGKVGGTTIDRNLHCFLEKRFGDAFTSLPLTKRGGKSAFMNAFEQCKRDFDGRSKQLFELPLKMKMLTDGVDDVKGYDTEEEQVLITSSEMEEFFEPVLQNILRLIEKQIAGVKAAGMPSVKTIVLVGGLGSSRYVHDRLEKWIKETLKGRIELVTPERPWSAISEGAAIRGIGRSPVEARRSRDWIGIMVHKPFDEDQHDEEDAFMCPDTGKRAARQMEWVVERGDKIKPNMKKTVPCFATFSKHVKSEDAILYQDIYSCTADEAPASLDETVVKIARIVVDLHQVLSKERSKKKLKTSKGTMPAFQSIDVDVEITMGSDKGVLLVTAKHRSSRIKVGRMEIEYVADPAWNGVLAVGAH